MNNEREIDGVFNVLIQKHLLDDEVEYKKNPMSLAILRGEVSARLKPQKSTVMFSTPLRAKNWIEVITSSSWCNSDGDYILIAIIFKLDLVGF